MTQNDIRQAVMMVNNTLATNNPKGVTSALKSIGYPVDSRFDILSYSDLTNALMNFYVSNPEKWGEVVQSVKFNYEKTDDSTSANTRAIFENIIKSIDPSYISPSSTGKFTLPKWAETAIGLLVGQTTTTHVVPADVSLQAKTSPWVYVAYAVLGLAILGIVYITFKQKNI